MFPEIKQTEIKTVREEKMMKKLYFDIHRASLAPSGETNVDELNGKATKVIKKAQRPALLCAGAAGIQEVRYDELSFDVGFSALINGHYIKLIGVDEEKQVEVVENVVEATEIERMLVNNDVTAFAKFIPNASTAEKESAVTLAVEHKVTNAGIAALIKKYCDVDVIKAIAVKHEAEEK